MKRTVILAIPRSGHNFVTNVFRSWIPKPGIVSGHENIMPPYVKSVMTSPEDHVVILIRDLLNWAASWLKYGINQKFIHDEPKVHKEFENWLILAKEALGYQPTIPNRISCYYDAFVSDPIYRQGICKFVEGEYTEDALDIVPNRGRGSSFDKLTMDGKGTQMQVLERWRWLSTEEARPHLHFIKAHRDVLIYYMNHFRPSCDMGEFVNILLK